MSAFDRRLAVSIGRLKTSWMCKGPDGRKRGELPSLAIPRDDLSALWGASSSQGTRCTVDWQGRAFEVGEDTPQHASKALADDIEPVLLRGVLRLAGAAPGEKVLVSVLGPPEPAPAKEEALRSGLHGDDVTLPARLGKEPAIVLGRLRVELLPPPLVMLDGLGSTARGSGLGVHLGYDATSFYLLDVEEGCEILRVLDFGFGYAVKRLDMRIRDQGGQVPLWELCRLVVTGRARNISVGGIEYDLMGELEDVRRELNESLVLESRNVLTGELVRRGKRPAWAVMVGEAVDFSAQDLIDELRAEGFSFVGDVTLHGAELFLDGLWEGLSFLED